MFKYGIFDRPIEQQALDIESGGEQAHAIGVQTAVLLQNNGALPLPPDTEMVLLVGKASQIYAQQAVAGGSMVGRKMGDGGGSSDVVPYYTVSPIEGLRNSFARSGNDSVTIRLALVDDENQHATIDGAEASFKEVLELAATADAVVAMTGTVAEEGADRASFSDASGGVMTARGDSLDWYAPVPKSISFDKGDNAGRNSRTVAMIDQLLAVESATDYSIAQKTALVLKDNAGVPLPARWLGERGPAMLEVWFPGQEDGNIVGDVLLGLHNPSGKLPVTFPVEGEDFMATVTPQQYPGVMDKEGIPHVEYSEGLQMGYRWYDANGVRPPLPSATDCLTPPSRWKSRGYCLLQKARGATVSTPQYVIPARGVVQKCCRFISRFLREVAFHSHPSGWLVSRKSGWSRVRVSAWRLRLILQPAIIRSASGIARGTNLLFLTGYSRSGSAMPRTA